MEIEMNIGDKVQDHRGRDFVIKKVETVQEPEAATMVKRGWLPFILTLQGRERERTAYVDEATGEIRCMVSLNKTYPGRFK